MGKRILKILSCSTLSSKIQLKEKKGQTESVAQHQKYEKPENIIFHSEHHHKITLQYFFSKFTFIRVFLLTEYFTLNIIYSPKKTRTQNLFLIFLENLHSKLITNKQTNKPHKSPHQNLIKQAKKPPKKRHQNSTK